MLLHHASVRRFCRRACVIPLALIASAALGQGVDGLTFEQALTTAVQRAPMVAARTASAEGAAVARVSADRLPDPRLTAGVDNLPVTGADRFSLTSDFMTMGRIGWMQEVPNRDKRAARADVAQALADRERALLAAERQVVRRSAALAWLERYYVEKRLGLFADLEREITVLQQTVNARVAAGRALPAEATVARLEAVQLADRRDGLERERAQAQSALVRWVGSAGNAPLLGEAAIPAVDAPRLREKVARHVDLAAFEPMARVATAEVREAQADKRGDWAWEVAYQKRGSEFSDMVSVQLSFELPLFAAKRQDPQIYAKRKEVERIEAEREEKLRERLQDIEAQLAQQEELTRRLARLRETALPLADERVRLTMASYQAGRSDLNAVLVARRERIETRFNVIQTEAQLAALRAQLAYLFTEDRP